MNETLAALGAIALLAACNGDQPVVENPPAAAAAPAATSAAAPETPQTSEPIAANTPVSPQMSAALQHKIRIAAVRVVAEGTVVGATAGCGFRLLRGSLRGCASSLAAGGAVGAGAGLMLASGNTEAATAEAREQELIAALRDEQTDLQSYNEKVRSAVDALNRELRTLKRQRKGRSITVSRYDREQARLAQQLEQLTSSVEENRKQVEERNTVVAENSGEGEIQEIASVNLNLISEALLEVRSVTITPTA